ncbi:cellulose binding domain-containing protein [Actinoplanes sp. M2I2]|uniref:cellulose binding domain-containing protein n=1 Tax=Actinoplanes sp. M2I2 TaxID=1734444 RepID=UPI0020226780|nr:cellulose binding domain-containing protein [Actinoplanes sp. M2I2]
MAAKHSVSMFGTARFVLSFAVAILVLLVVWVAVRAVGPAEAAKQPGVVLPSIPRVTIAAPPPTTSAAPKPSPSRSRTAAARTSKPIPEAQPTTERPPTTRPTPSPTEKTSVEATLSVGATWDEGYVAAVRVTNEGDRAVEWKVTVSHEDLEDLELRGVWNAKGNVAGSSLVFTGGRLEPGRTASFGYQTSKDGRGKARPSGCNALGGSCRVR